MPDMSELLEPTKTVVCKLLNYKSSPVTELKLLKVKPPLPFHNGNQQVAQLKLLMELHHQEATQMNSILEEEIVTMLTPGGWLT